MLEDLIARDIVFIEDVDAVEEKFFLHLGHVLAGFAQAEFGMQDDAALTARAQKAEMDLQRVASIGPTYNTMEVQAY